MTAATAVKNVFQDNAPDRSAAAPLDLRAALPARENIFQIMFPKGGRTLGLPDGMKDADFWPMLGFEISNRLTPDMYALRDTTGELAGSDVEIWVNERKPLDIVSRLSMPDRQGWAQGNIGLVGTDTLNEFEYSTGGGAGRKQGMTIALERVMRLDLSRGAIAMLVPETFEMNSMRDLEGQDIVTKYQRTSEKFRKKIERDYSINMGFVKEAKGGTEDDILLDRDLNVIIDFVQSGASAVKRGLRVAFADAALWDSIKSGERRFDDLSLHDMQKMRGVLETSAGILVRPFQQFTPAQEEIGKAIEQRIAAAISAMGRTPAPLQQRGNRPGPQPRLRNKQDNCLSGVGHLAARGM